MVNMSKNIDTIKAWLGTGSINVFGQPFAGKDTQARKLAKLFDGIVISGGDIMRRSRENQQVQQAMASGGIVPSELFEEIVLPVFSNPANKEKPLILSEVGRMEGEQQVITRAAQSAGHTQRAVVLLQMPEDEIHKRFEAAKEKHDRGERADDRPEVLQTRLDNYHEKVFPVIEWYRDKGLLIEIDGTLKPKEVTQRILEKLNSIAKQDNNS